MAAFLMKAMLTCRSSVGPGPRQAQSLAKAPEQEAGAKTEVGSHASAVRKPSVTAAAPCAPGLAKAKLLRG